MVIADSEYLVDVLKMNSLKNIKIFIDIENMGMRGCELGFIFWSGGKFQES